tara:strand:+ start:1465 stop:1626 length:162 start_codon:yes stop_codon:yes gene_type:complete
MARNVFPATKRDFLLNPADRDLYKRLKDRAAMAGISLRRLVLDMLREHLGGHQ